MSKKNMIISTTDILQGYDIEEYVDYIEATSTIGSGFLTEFLSSWTDTFGTKSNMIENKIHIIKQEVKRKLMDKALDLRCNAIIGLTIDVDEISSNQKMIFMVTAAGTAIKCKRCNDQNSGTTISGDFLNQKLYLAKELHDKLMNLVVLDISKMQDFTDISDEMIQNGCYASLESIYVEQLIRISLIIPTYEIFNNTILEVLNSMDHVTLSKAFLETLLILSEDKDRILKFRQTVSYQTFCRFFGDVTPLQIINDFLSRGNDYFNVIVIFPLLREFKDAYDNHDINHLENIVMNLKRKFWNMEIDAQSLAKNERICECGSIVHNNETCSCGSSSTISSSTYKDKTIVIKQLEGIIKELNAINWE